MAEYELQTRPLTNGNMNERLSQEAEEQDQRSRNNNPTLMDNAHLNRRVVKKLDFVLLPFLSLFFLVNSLDRSNVGNAETANFTRDAGLQPEDLNTAVACFFTFFVALQPVGAALGRRIGMRIFVPTCMIIWGFLTALHVGITKKWQLILIRSLIGILEAGFYPTSVSYISIFYTRYEFAKRLGVFYGQYAVAGALGCILSFAIFSYMPPEEQRNPQQWKSWQLLFLLEGGLTMVIAFVGYFWLPDSADSAWFFSAEEQQHAEERIVRDREHRDITNDSETRSLPGSTSNLTSERRNIQDSSNDEAEHLLPGDERSLKSSKSKYSSGLTSARGLDPRDIVEAFTDWKVFYLLLMNILSAIPAAAFTVFLPLVVQGFGFDSVKANLFTAPPFAAGAIVLWFFVYWSDQCRERIKPILWGLAILIVGLTAVVMLPTDLTGIRYAFLCIMLGGSFVASPLTISWFTNNIEEPGKRSVILGINGWGNFAGVFSSVIFAPSFAPYYQTPFFVTLGLVIASFVGFLSFRGLLQRENRRRRELVSSWDQSAVESELYTGSGPSETQTDRVRQTIGRTVSRGTTFSGHRGEDRLTFTYGL